MLFKMVAKQSAPALSRGLSLNFWWLRSVSHIRFTKEYVMCMEKHVLDKNVYRWAKHSFATMSQI